MTTALRAGTRAGRRASLCRRRRGSVMAPILPLARATGCTRQPRVMFHPTRTCARLPRSRHDFSRAHADSLPRVGSPRWAFRCNLPVFSRERHVSREAPHATLAPVQLAIEPGNSRVPPSSAAHDGTVAIGPARCTRLVPPERRLRRHARQHGRAVAEVSAGGPHARSRVMDDGDGCESRDTSRERERRGQQWHSAEAARSG